MSRVIPSWAGIIGGLLMAASVPVFASTWSLPYGSGPGQVGFFNSSSTKTFQEAAPFGPMSFRLNGQDIWVLDSIRGQIMRLPPDRKKKTTIAIPGTRPDSLFEDFALVRAPARQGARQTDPVGVWVADGATLQVQHLQLPGGKETIRFGGPGQKPGQFQQIHQLETGPSGRVYVGDYGKNVIAVFSPLGVFECEIPWQTTGFCLDKKEQILTIRYSEDSGYFLETYSGEGNLMKTTHLGLPTHQNPRIWALEKDGSFWVTFVPSGGFRGFLNLIHFSGAGAPIEKWVFHPPTGMNRFLDIDQDGRKVLAEADFDLAPKGTFTIKTLSMEAGK